MVKIMYYAYVMANGLLIQPKDRYGDNVFNPYGYESKEEIYHKMDRAGITQDIVIIEKTSLIAW